MADVPAYTYTVTGAMFGRAKLFRAVARGYVDTGSPLGTGIYDGETGALIAGGSRSYLLRIIRRADGAVVDGGVYDVNGNASTAAAMAAIMNAYGSSHFAIVVTHDEPKGNRLTNGLDAAMYRCGAIGS